MEAAAEDDGDWIKQLARFVSLEALSVLSSNSE
jgi:hypothetical protein